MAKHYTVQGQLPQNQRQKIQTERFLAILREHREEIVRFVYSGRERHARGANWQYALNADQIKSVYRDRWPGKQPSRGLVVDYMRRLVREGTLRARAGYWTTNEPRDAAAEAAWSEECEKKLRARLARLRRAAPGGGFRYQDKKRRVSMNVEAVDALLDLVYAPGSRLIERK